MSVDLAQHSLLKLSKTEDFTFFMDESDVWLMNEPAPACSFNEKLCFEHVEPGQCCVEHQCSESVISYH